MNKYINKVIKGDILSIAESEDVMRCISKKVASDLEAAMILTAMQTRGEDPDEVIGFLNYLKKQQIRIVTANRRNIIDICGTGGDASRSFNISTATSFVLAGGGVYVGKHGGRSVSSRSGSTDVLEALGIPIAFNEKEALRHLDKFHCAFLPAPMYNPTFKEYGTLRKEMGIRSYFNLLGPLLNPIGITRQIMGVYDQHLIELVANVMIKLGAENVIVVHSEDGLDEFSISATSNYAHIHDGKIEYLQLTPEDVGLKKASIKDIQGGDSKTNAFIIESVLQGDPGPKRDIILLNAAAGFIVAGKADNFIQGIVHAQESIDSGKAYNVLKFLKEEANSL